MLRLRIRTDPYNFGNPDPDRNQSQKPYSDPHEILNLDAVEAQNGAMEGLGPSQWRRGGTNEAAEGL
jgi:hypothetical protein